MIKLLIVTYDFPPVGGVGIQRILKWVKYFHNFDIEPVILTNGHGLGYVQDDSLLNLDYLKKIKIYRQGGEKLKIYHTLKKQGKLHSFHNFLLLFRYIWKMDVFSSWFYEIKSNVLNIVKNEQVDCILTTSPPHSTHIFGKYIKDNLSIPWVMDLRDSMTSLPGRNNIVSFLQNLTESQFEQKFYSGADHIIFATELMRSSAQKRCSNFPMHKATVIKNGFDPSDFSNTDTISPESQKKFCITYTGTLRSYHYPQIFCNALLSIIQKGIIPADDIEIKLVGKLNPEKKEEFKNLAEVASIKYTGTVPHEEAIKFQLTADLLLLILPIDSRGNQREVLTGKVFEYIGSGKTIFALATEGELADLIRENKFGYVADPEDQDEVEKTLLNAYHNWKQGINIVSSENREKFTRESQCETLSHLIKNITG